jgi:hypothetical protein
MLGELLMLFVPKVWPPEAFEEGTEFLELLSKSFVNAHGLRLKIAFAETFLHLLHQIGKVSTDQFSQSQSQFIISKRLLKLRSITPNGGNQLKSSIPRRRK